jgi:hypothetical protein
MSLLLCLLLFRKKRLECLMMGKPVESYRIRLEGEISRWNGFARALRREDREAFDELMDECRSYASESSNATNPIIFEPMVICILLAQQKRILQLERKLQTIKIEVPNPSRTALETSQWDLSKGIANG